MSEFQPDPKIAYFISRLERLDPGGRAKLKRSAGETLEEAHEIAFFYSLLPNGVPEKQEGTYFLAATLFPLAEAGGKGDLGTSLHNARNDKNAKGLDRRVQALLDADEAQLPYRLRRAIFILKSSRVRVNWGRLLQDLLQWNASTRFVQRQWARSYFGE
jgi:CRISPR system Cascade subunit CasB